MIKRSFLKGAGIGEPLRISNSCQEEVDKEGILGKKNKKVERGVERVTNMVYLGAAGENRSFVKIMRNEIRKNSKSKLQRF